jgi:thiosulfate dehydrogenase [quinone] large subunit
MSDTDRDVIGDREVLHVSNARVMAAVRITVGLLWLTNAGWKIPPDFGEDGGRGLYRFTAEAIEHPVFPPFSWLVEEVILPNFVVFGWMVLLSEAALAAFLLLGLGTRLWALVGVVQSVAIGMSVALAPNEWPWSYALMIAVHAALFATAAGRTWGLDALVRPALRLSGSRAARLAEVAT